MENILQNIALVQQRITNTCERVGRKPEEVKLLLATKTVTPERIKVALNAGYTLIAENKVQELKEKYEALKDTPHTNHFIGHLQTNKIKDILRYEVSCVESIDRLDLAQKLHNRLESEGKKEWLLYQQAFRDGVVLTPTPYGQGKIKVKNSLPSSKATKIFHIRPHTGKSAYLIDGVRYGNGSDTNMDELPNGDFMTKQSFWLNKSYVYEIVKDVGLE